MKKEKLTDEQIYQLLESNNLPFRKIEHFARFLETAKPERILKYFANYNAFNGQELYFVQNAPADLIIRYFKEVDRFECEFDEETMLAIVRRGDHNIIMAMFDSRIRFASCPQLNVEVIKRGNGQEIDKLIARCDLSAEGLIELLKYDRVHQTNKSLRFLSNKSYYPPKEVKLDLFKRGSYEQIKAYIGKRLSDSFGFSSLEGELLETLLKREDIFLQLLKDVPSINLDGISMCKHASHQQMMLWLKKKPFLGYDKRKEFCHHLISRRNVDELLLLEDHFFQCNFSASDIQIVLDLEEKVLARWLVEEHTSIRLNEEHIYLMLERGWLDLVCKGCKVHNISSLMGVFNAVARYGDDDAFAKVLKSIDFFLEGERKAALVAIISTGNPKWIAMCAKKFELKKQFKF